jgi:glycosyltransferase involved in cell wall biosynthesis
VNTEVVYNGVDPEMFLPGSVGDVGQAIVLSVGDLIASKGQKLVLQALARVKGRFSRAQYEIVGDGPDLLSLQKLASDLKIESHVHFRGRRSRREVADAMRNCTVFALPSHYEGLGCAYLEAMACAKPVIGCRGQGIEEILRESPQLVDGGSVDELADALTHLLSNSEQREEIGRANRRIILDSLTLSHQAERLNRVYRGCLV